MGETAHLEEAAADEQPAIRHKGLCQRKNGVVAACAGVEGGIQRAIGHQTGQPIAVQPIDLGERATRQNAAIALHQYRLDRTIGAGEPIEEGGASIEPSVFSRAMLLRG